MIKATKQKPKFQMCAQINVDGKPIPASDRVRLTQYAAGWPTSHNLQAAERGVDFKKIPTAGRW